MALDIRLDPINPKLGANSAGFLDAIHEILAHESSAGIELFEKTASKFQGVIPVFERRKVEVKGEDYDRVYGALKNYSGDDNLIYSVLNYGGVQRTVLHAERPPMKFRLGYRAGTSPSRPLNPVPSQPGTGPWIVTRRIRRRVDPRRFDEAIVKRRRRYVARQSRTKIKNAAKKMWLNVETR